MILKKPREKKRDLMPETWNADPNAKQKSRSIYFRSSTPTAIIAEYSCVVKRLIEELHALWCFHCLRLIFPGVFWGEKKTWNQMKKSGGKIDVEIFEDFHYFAYNWNGFRSNSVLLCALWLLIFGNWLMKVSRLKPLEENSSNFPLIESFHMFINEISVSRTPTYEAENKPRRHCCWKLLIQFAEIKLQLCMNIFF